MRVNKVYVIYDVKTTLPVAVCMGCEEAMQFLGVFSRTTLWSLENKENRSYKGLYTVASFPAKYLFEDFEK